MPIHTSRCGKPTCRLIEAGRMRLAFFLQLPLRAMGVSQTRQFTSTGAPI